MNFVKCNFHSGHWPYKVAITHDGWYGEIGRKNGKQWFIVVGGGGWGGKLMATKYLCGVVGGSRAGDSSTGWLSPTV